MNGRARAAGGGQPHGAVMARRSGEGQGPQHGESGGGSTRARREMAQRVGQRASNAGGFTRDFCPLLLSRSPWFPPTNFLASLSMRAISRFSKLRSKALANKSKLKFSISFISLNLLTFPPQNCHTPFVCH